MGEPSHRGLVEISRCLRGLAGVLDTLGMVCLQEGGWGGPQVRGVLGVHTGGGAPSGVGEFHWTQDVSLPLGSKVGVTRPPEASPKLLFSSYTLYPAFASTWPNVQPGALWDFPGCPGVGTLHFHCWGHADHGPCRTMQIGPGFDPRSGN